MFESACASRLHIAAQVGSRQVVFFKTYLRTGQTEHERGRETGEDLQQKATTWIEPAAAAEDWSLNTTIDFKHGPW